jgi:predicted transcriptional regulator
MPFAVGEVSDKKIHDRKYGFDTSVTALLMSSQIKQNRTVLGIARDILQACMDAGIDGIMISKISQRANLSYSSAMNTCHKLINADMIRYVRNKRSHIFTITEKGIRFFKEFQKFQDTVREINIRY